MSSVLVAYTTTEGQTQIIANYVAKGIDAKGNKADVVELSAKDTSLSIESYDAVVVAASVHTGKHQRSALDFVKRNRYFLMQKTTAFISVSLSAATENEAGLKVADEQVRSFLRETDWRPDYVEMIGGAFRYSDFSRLWKWIILTTERLCKKELQKRNWPDLTTDQEFTDWEFVGDFVERFCARIDTQ